MQCINWTILTSYLDKLCGERVMISVCWCLCAFLFLLSNCNMIRIDNEFLHVSDKMYQSGTTEQEMSVFDLPPFVIPREDMKLKDVVRESVLPFLPAKSLGKFKSVSKEWNQWIKSPLLAFQQSNHFKELSGFFAQNELRNPTFISLNPSAYGVPSPNLTFLPERVDILSSCSGLLLCYGRDHDDLYYICNPANKEFTVLRKPNLYHGYGSGAVLSFEPSARNIDSSYQVIFAVPLPGELRFELYNSGTKLWTASGVNLVETEDLSFKHDGFYMKGIAYWLTNTGSVVALNVEKELYEVIPLPCTSDGVLTQIHGEICFITMSHFSENKYHISIYGGMDMSLKSSFEVSIGESSESLARFNVLPCFDGKKVMILFEDRIYSYSINDQILEEKVSGIGSVRAHKHLAYVNSLVQLPGRGARLRN